MADRMSFFSRLRKNYCGCDHSMVRRSGATPVCLVHLVSLMQPNKPDRPNRPNEQDRLADFSIILLEIYPELSIGPILIGAGAQVLLDIPAGEYVAIGHLEGQHAIHEHVCPNDIHFVADVPLGIVCL